jgi:HAD superfamily hydrolase (TIGR01509 family)
MRGVVFDMDGVIVNSEAEWKSMAGGYFRKLAPGWTKEHDERAVGLGVEDLHRFLVSEFDADIELRDFLEACEVTARKVYQQRVECAEGFLDLARELKHKGIKTAIASSSPERWVKMVIERFSLSPLLDAVVTADDVGGKTKPLPDIYLETASRLSLPTVECLAVEDSSIGLLAAKRAGMKAAAFRNGTNDAQDLSLADFELGSFAGLSYDKLVSRLRR